MSDIDYLQWDTSGLDPEEREALLEDVLSDLGVDAAIVDDEAELEALREATAAQDAATALGTQLGGMDPELVLITLESTIIAIETAKLAGKVAGSGGVWTRTLRSTLGARGQDVATHQADDVTDVLDESTS